MERKNKSSSPPLCGMEAKILELLLILRILKAPSSSSSSWEGGQGQGGEDDSCAKTRNKRFFTRHVSHVVDVVRPDVPGADQHVGFAQQRPEMADVCGRHGRVPSAFVAHAVHDLCGGGGAVLQRPPAQWQPAAAGERPFRRRRQQHFACTAEANRLGGPPLWGPSDNKERPITTGTPSRRGRSPCTVDGNDDTARNNKQRASADDAFAPPARPTEIRGPRTAAGCRGRATHRVLAGHVIRSLRW